MIWENNEKFFDFTNSFGLRFHHTYKTKKGLKIRVMKICKQMFVLWR